MTLPSLPDSATTAAGSVSGAVKAATADDGFVSAAVRAGQSAAGGIFSGIQQAGLNAADDLVGGRENRELIQGAAGKVYDGAADLLTGKTSISSLFSTTPKTTYTAVAGAPTDYADVNGMCMGPEGGIDLVVPPIDAAVLMAGSEGSDWGGLNQNLIGRIFACDADGLPLMGPTSDKPDQSYEPLGVAGPCTEMTFETSQNWQSPFESTGPEAKAPALMAMLQSGSLVPVINAIQATDLFADSAVSGALNSAAEKAKKIAKELEGRTGITKLNSRQVFSGMPPLKVSFTMHFRALTDPQTEVMEPYQRLLEFAMPQVLAGDGVLTEVIASTSSENSSFLKAMFPSIAPLIVGFTFANNRFPPMVIEAISNPLDGPMDSNGRPTYRAVQIMLATLTATDRADIKKMFV